MARYAGSNLVADRSTATQDSGAWRRHALFAISIAMLAGGLLLGQYDSASQSEFLRAILLKVGIVLFMLWLALPQLQKLNWFAIIPVGCIAVLAVVRPQLIVIIARVVVPLAPVLFLIWLFWKPKQVRP